MIRAAARVLDQTTGRRSGALVARRDFVYQDKTTKETVAVARGATVDAVRLQENGCNLEKLCATGFLRSAVES